MAVQVQMMVQLPEEKMGPMAALALATAHLMAVRMGVRTIKRMKDQSMTT